MALHNKQLMDPKNIPAILEQNIRLIRAWKYWVRNKDGTPTTSRAIDSPVKKTIIINELGQINHENAISTYCELGNKVLSKNLRAVLSYQ